MSFESERVFHRVALLCLLGILFGTGTPARAEDPAGEPGPQAPAAPADDLSRTKAELERARSEIEALGRRVDVLEASDAAAEAAPAISTARLAPVNADNPSISFVVDTALATDTGSSWESIGYPNGWDFTLKNAELFISAPIDPYARGYASINATSDSSFDVEEAAIVTTALPWGLTLKGGRFFADVGRLPHWHDESLPFVDRPPSINRLIGGESTSEGLQASWLMPLDLFVEVTGGFYDTIGADNLDDLNSNGFFGYRSFGELTALGRVHTYVDLTDTWNVELGAN